MKRFFIVLLAVFSFVACKVTPPDEVALRFLKALTSGDVNYAKENIYFPNKSDYAFVCEYLDMVAKTDKYKSGVAEFKTEYRVAKCLYEGDEAFVELIGKNITGNYDVVALRMLRIDGRWLVDGKQSVLSDIK